MPGILEALDAQLEQLFKPWNIWSSFLVLAIGLVTIYPLLTYKEPDTHPLLLSRQSNIAQVRQPKESAVYRSIETPHGLPLRSGLNVREEGQSKWSPGKDGDVRDVWRRVVTGTLNDEGKPTGKRSTIQTVYGREEVETHDNAELSKQINSIGRYIKSQGATTVALYLPNSVELLLTIFAAVFYGFHPVLIPYGIPQDVVFKLVNVSTADFLIAEAGTVSLNDVKSKCKDVRQMMYVVEKTSRHMDWREDDQKVTTSTWHDTVQEKSSSETAELPSNSQVERPQDVATVWLNKTNTSGEMVSFSQRNIVAAAAAQASALPMRHRMSPDDLYLPADSLTQPYILVQTLAALYHGASLALNSVAGPQVDLATAAVGVSPTIVSGSAASAAKLYNETKDTIAGGAKKMALNSQKQALEAGYMPPATVLSRINTPTRVNLGRLPDKLRLLYICERANTDAPPLTSDMLTELRALTGARIVYALTAPKVAGSVAQTAFYDYRVDQKDRQTQSHFGAPVSSVEVKLVDTDSHKNVEGQAPMGEVSRLHCNLRTYANSQRRLTSRVLQLLVTRLILEYMLRSAMTVLLPMYKYEESKYDGAPRL